jgi:hypothetical protein
MENFVGEFYEIVRNSQVNNCEKLMSFVNEFDIQETLAENGSLDIDIKKLLELS